MEYIILFNGQEEFKGAKIMFLGVWQGEGVKEREEISKEVYEEYSLHLEKVIQFEQEFNLYVTVSHNYEELLETIDVIKEGYIKDARMNWAKMSAIMLTINRRVLNYLTTFRTYLDHAERLLKHEFGKESEQVKIFKEVCSREYDDYFAYRFLYKLRNYAQHCGMPVGNVNLSAKEIVNGVEHTLLVHLDRNQLLSAKDLWGKPVKEELQEMPLEIEITVYLKELQTCIERIQECFMKIRLKTIKGSAEYILELFKPLLHIEGAPCIIDDSDLVGKDKGDIHLKWVPMHIVQLVYGMSQEYLKEE
ncbi:hypothetical protein [Bacillus cereus]|uniref:hypothetical protein n=1 Tax=Bacillus cereus TaxID=1396 RepID=UPI003D17F633